MLFLYYVSSYYHLLLYMCPHTNEPFIGTLAAAYQAWLGFYNGKLRKLNWTKADLVREANELALNCW
jgi:hypothetical protein